MIDYYMVRILYKFMKEEIMKMNLEKSIILLIFTFVISLFSIQAKAAIIGFDDRIANPIVPIIENGYHGFDWVNFGIINALNVAGLTNTATSGSNVAFNGLGGWPASISKNDPFFLNDLYIAGWIHDSFNLDITARDINNIIIFSDIYTIYANSPALIEFNLANVVELAFTPLKPDGTPASSDFWFVIDDFRYNEPVPEPSSMILGFIALGGMTGLRRNQKTA